MSTSPSLRALVSIVLEGPGRLGPLRRSLTALARHTRPPWELVVVTHGPGDMMVSYLTGFEDGSRCRVAVVPGGGAGGPAATFAAGLGAARGAYLAVLGTDVVVTAGWLDQLLALAASDPRIGVVGPRVVGAASPQGMAGVAVGYGDLAGLDAFATAWHGTHRGRWGFVEDLAGACLVLSRSVVDALVGPGRAAVSDAFDGGVAWRARAAGLGLAVAHDLYVHAGPWPPPPSSPAAVLGPATLASGGATMTTGPSLVWEGDVDGLHSLGLINRSLCRALVARGVDLTLAAAGVGSVTPERLPPDPVLERRRGPVPDAGRPHVWVAHRWPPRLDRPPSGRWVFFQPWEYGSLPRAWQAPACAAAEVWAYSQSVRDVYLEAGVPADRVHVVPLGADPEVFHPGVDPAALPRGPGFWFLFVGGTIRRKGIDLVLAAYARAFGRGDGVGLVVQDMGAGSFYRGQTAGAAVMALREAGYPVEYRSDPLPPWGLARLYAACDCAVQPYRGEGFALPVLEAMACGRAVIVTGEGPSRDYASESTAYLVPARRVALPSGPVGDLETVGRGWLWEPDVEELAARMRAVASDPAGARATGAAAAAWVRARFTWSHAAATLEVRLRAVLAASGARD